MSMSPATQPPRAYVPYRKLIRNGHLSEAAAQYPEYVRRYNARVYVASFALWCVALVIPVHLLTQLVP